MLAFRFICILWALLLGRHAGRSLYQFNIALLVCGRTYVESCSDFDALATGHRARRPFGPLGHRTDAQLAFGGRRCGLLGQVGTFAVQTARVQAGTHADLTIHQLHQILADRLRVAVHESPRTCPEALTTCIGTLAPFAPACHRATDTVLTQRAAHQPLGQVHVTSGRPSSGFELKITCSQSMSVATLVRAFTPLGPVGDRTRIAWHAHAATVRAAGRTVSAEWRVGLLGTVAAV